MFPSTSKSFRQAAKNRHTPSFNAAAITFTRNVLAPPVSLRVFNRYLLRRLALLIRSQLVLLIELRSSIRWSSARVRVPEGVRWLDSIHRSKLNLGPVVIALESWQRVAETVKWVPRGELRYPVWSFPVFLRQLRSLELRRVNSELLRHLRSPELVNSELLRHLRSPELVNSELPRQLRPLELRGVNSALRRHHRPLELGGVKSELLCQLRSHRHNHWFCGPFLRREFFLRRRLVALVIRHLGRCRIP